MAVDELELTSNEAAYKVEELVQVGETEKAKRVAAECVNRCKASGNDPDTALALKTLARARAAHGDTDDAIQPVNEALSMYKELGDMMGEGDCYADLSKLFLALDSTGDVFANAEKARKIYGDLKSTAGVGNMLHVQSMALRAEGDTISALRMAEKASEMLVEGGDLWTEVESLIVIAQMKLAIGQQANVPIPISTLHAAQAALALCKQRRPTDQTCMGEAYLTMAQVFLSCGASSPAAMAAKDATIAFRRAHNWKQRGRAMLVQASATAKAGQWKPALKTVEKATTLLDEAGDETGREQAFVVLDEIDDARRAAQGLPSRAEEAAMRQKELQDKRDREQQSQMMEMQQMMMMMQMMDGQAPSQAQWKTPVQQQPKTAAAAAPAPEAADKQIAVKSGGALMVSAGMDASIVRNKILDIATQIIGDDEEGIDADMPLMQAGLTSNTAVLLRDELSKDLPGVNLPPTLMFDYPSISAIADFIVENAK
jgi:tetratricopeptide (TPR) repeat protein/acyl carrier protein